MEAFLVTLLIRYGFTSNKLFLCTVVAKAESTDDQETVEESESVNVEFSVVARLEYGLSLKLCGSCEALGNWDLAAAPAMTWTDGDVWVLKTELPRDAIEAKCIAISENEAFAQWEPGANRIVQFPDVIKNGDVVLVELNYKDTDSVTISLRSSAIEDVSIDNNDRTNEQPEDVSIEEPSVLEDSEQTYDVDSEKEQVVVTNASVEKEDDGEEITPTTIITEDRSQPIPEAVEKPEIETPVDEPAQETPVAVADEVMSRKETVPRVIPELSTAEQPRNTTSVGNVVLTAVGIASLPIMLWSEFTLYRTGCGLPPGPAGLLGAAEGISYLTIVGICFGAIAQRTRSKSLAIPILVEFGSYLAITTGIAVIISQVATYGYIPSALPDQNCPAQPTSLNVISAIQPATLSFLTSDFGSELSS